MRQRVTSPDGSSAHWRTSFSCFAASACHCESARDCAMLSCCCWKRVAAARASGCFHLYCNTRHCAAPFASMVMALQLRTSSIFFASDLPHAAAPRASSAANPAFVPRIHDPLGVLATWRLGVCYRRTGWDSNPRYPCGHTGFRDRPFQPLTHLSLKQLHVAGCTLHEFAGPACVPVRHVTWNVQRESTDRVGFEPTKRLPVYTLSRRVPSATRPPIQTTRRIDG